MLQKIKGWLHKASWKWGWVNRKFPGTYRYWQDLYNNGGNSGPGSYNRLAHFKAEFINSFIEKEGIKKVIDLGCGDGHQLSLLHVEEYIGFDITEAAIEKCKHQFKNDASKSFFLYNASFPEKLERLGKARLSVSLDVLFHLIEDDVFDQYMNDLFLSSQKYVIIYSTNYESRQIFHEKNRLFTDWIRKNKREWRQMHFEVNPFPFDKKDPGNTSESNFYVFQLTGQ